MSMFVFAFSGIRSKNPEIKITIRNSYIKMKVCMCVCMSGGLPQDLHNLAPWNLAWAPHFTRAQHRARGQPQMLTHRGTPYSDPIWKTLKGKELGGGHQTKVAPPGGFECKILFLGGSPKPGVHRVHPTKWGCMLWELGRDQQTKVAPRVGWCIKILFVGVLTPTQSSQGP
jgi:hypothetical protein